MNITETQVQRLNQLLDQYPFDSSKDKELDNRRLSDLDDMKAAMWVQDHLSKGGSSIHIELETLKNKIKEFDTPNKVVLNFLNRFIDLPRNFESDHIKNKNALSLQNEVKKLKKGQSLTLGLGNNVIMHAMALRIKKVDPGKYEAYFTNSGYGISTYENYHPYEYNDSNQLVFQITPLFEELSSVDFSLDFFKRLLRLQSYKINLPDGLSKSEILAITDKASDSSLKKYYRLIKTLGKPTKTTHNTHPHLWGAPQLGPSCTALAILYQIKSALPMEDFNKLRTSLLVQSFIKNYTEFSCASQPTKSKQILILDTLEDLVYTLKNQKESKNKRLLEKLNRIQIKLRKREVNSDFYIARKNIPIQASKVESYPSPSKKKPSNSSNVASEKKICFSKKKQDAVREKGRQILHLFKGKFKVDKKGHTKNLKINSEPVKAVQYTGVNLFIYQLYLAGIQHNDKKMKELFSKKKYMDIIFTKDTADQQSHCFHDLNRHVFKLFCTLPFHFQAIKSRTNISRAFAFSALCMRIAFLRGIKKEIKRLDSSYLPITEVYDSMQISDHINESSTWMGQIMSELSD